MIAETVNEVRFTLDSVFIGPNERQSLLLVFKDGSLPPMFVEDMLVEIENFVTNEGPQLLRDGGKISVTNNILPVVRTLRNLVIQAHDPANRDKVPDGFRTARVRRSLDDLRDQLGELIRLTEQVEQQVPPPEDKLSISGIGATATGDESDGYMVDIWFFGSGIDPMAGVTLHSTTALPGTAYQVVFYSAERIDVTFDPDGSFALQPGEHEVTLTNPDGESATLRFTYGWDGNGNASAGQGPPPPPPPGGGGAASRSARSLAGRPAAKNRKVVIETGGGEVGPAASAAGVAIPVAAAAAPASVAPVPAVVAPVATAPLAPAETPTTPTAPAPAAIVQPPPVSQEQIAALQRQIGELKAIHESGIKRLEDLILGKSKDKDKKSKDDD